MCQSPWLLTLDQPLLLCFDLKDALLPPLHSVQAFGPPLAPLWLLLLGAGVSEQHGLVPQHAAHVLLPVRLEAVAQEGLGEGLCPGAGLRLNNKNSFTGDESQVQSEVRSE